MKIRKQRIDTQIHRRRKAKALSALEVEWDQSDAKPPSQLRMSPSRKNRETPPEHERP
ncbi:MAG: hypothetical protein ICV75_00180 [Nitrospiraceae bacterium]|nr:hypothetical protein [Nitrospiraceae bacterium]